MNVKKNKDDLYCIQAWIGEENITLVKKQNPTEMKDDYDF